MNHAASSPAMRIAVVTPCWQEPPEVLAKCMASVKAQTHSVTHILVSDGEPFVVPETDGVIRIQLPFNIGNYGSTPRGFGGQLAFNMGFDAVAFLDADNWYEPDHIEQVANALQHSNADVVFAKRRIVFPDGEVMSSLCAEDESGRHVDTNCYVFRHTASYLMKAWLMWPAEFGAGEDRMIFNIVRYSGLHIIRMTKPTVWYVTNWAIHYKAQGKAPVAPLRQPSRNLYKNYDEVTYFQLSGIRAKLSTPSKSSDVSSVGAQTGLVVVDWRNREATNHVLPQLADVNLYALPDDVMHPCDLEQAENVFGIKFPRHVGYAGTAAGLSAALLFLRGCERVLVVQGDWTAVQRELPDIVARVLNTNEPFHAESVTLNTGETCQLTLFRQTQAHLCLLHAQLPTDLDVERRHEWLKSISQWWIQAIHGPAKLTLPDKLSMERSKELQSRLGLRLQLPTAGAH